MSLATTSAAAAAAAAPLLRPRRFDVRTKPGTPNAAGPAPRRKACRQRKGLVQLALINPEIAGSNEVAYENPGKEIARGEVEAAADTIDRVMKKVLREMMVSEGVAFVAGDEHGETTLKEAIAVSLKDEADNLSDVFLATLMQYTKSAKDKGQEQVAGMLSAIYEETILYVENKMPAEMKLLSQLIEQPSSKIRDEAIRAAIAEEEGGSSATCNLESLAITSTRMVEDMEKRSSVPDRNLLIRLCLVREELRVTALRNGQMSPELVKFQAVIPTRVSHFIKELIPVSDSARRVALLEKVMRGDWEGAAPKIMGTQKERINRAKFRMPEDEVPDVVRPGALMSTLLRLQIAMEADKNKIQDNKRKLTRVAEIRNEALQVMKRMAFEDYPN